MEIVLDTVSIHKSITDWEVNPLTNHIVNKKLQIVVDKDGGIIDEWMETCGCEIIQQLVIIWQPVNGIKIINRPPALPLVTRRKLQQFGFIDTIDKLILRVAYATAEKKVVSDDSDFWDPSDTRLIGNKKAKIAKYLVDNLNIKLYILADIVG